MPTCYFPMAHIGIKQAVRPENEINLFLGFRLDYSKCAHHGIASRCGRKRKDLLTGSRLEKGGGGAASAASPCGAVARPASFRQACGRPFFQAAEPGRRLRRCILMFLNSAPLRPRWRSYVLRRLCSEIRELTQKTAMTSEHFFDYFVIAIDFSRSLVYWK